MERVRINSECRFVKLKNNKLIYRCRECKEEWERPIEGLIRKFPSIYQFCNDDFILIFVYPYEDMDSWEKLDETTIPPKETFYSKLNLEDTTDKDYEQTQKVWKVF